LARKITDDRARLIFLTLMTTALRRGELQRLRWGDVDLIDNVLRVRVAKTEQGVRAVRSPGGARRGVVAVPAAIRPPG
jgi:integrase